MKILLTGADGYIGTRLGQALLAAGHKVTELDTGFFNSAEFYDDGLNHLELIRKDIREITPLDFEGIDVVVHLAELCNDPLGELNPELTREINHLGTKKVGELAKQAGIKRLVYFSSCSVYGASDEVMDETSPTNPLTVYAQSKVLNEQVLLDLADDNFSPIILRLATVYGISPRLRFDVVVNNLSGLAWTTREIKMESNGEPWRPFVHIADVCRAVVCVLKAPREQVHKEIFNVGDSQSNYQIKQVAETVAAVFPGCKLSLNPEGVDKRNYRVNFDKINTRLPGFRCEKTIADGAKELLAIFQKTPVDREVFASRHYTRIKQMQYLLANGLIDKQFYWAKK